MPQAASIQQLENRVAKLLKRCPHRLVIQNNKAAALRQDEIMGAPSDPIDFDYLAWSDLQIAYEHDWPTFRRLKGHPETMNHYLWHWGILWDKGLVPYPWSRELFGVPADMPVEDFLPALTKAHIIIRRDMAAGILPEYPSYREILAIARSYGFPC
ncbi:hypothetical protein [Paraburkholderia nodosa]|uniref:hypothetical protein n=1 Tax=Paraburkholderia nodosa TaxID=392320 RepID=UPI000487DB4A|nr:hypothetical protein [Paraburkholderia nodosa]